MGAPGSVIQSLQKAQNSAAIRIRKVPPSSTIFYKNSIGFPYQSASNTKLLAWFSMLSLALLRPISLTCYICILLLALSVRPRTHAYSEFNDANARPMVFDLFSHFGPYIWNSLPHNLRHCSTISLFKAHIKTFPFSQYSGLLELIVNSFPCASVTCDHISDISYGIQTWHYGRLMHGIKYTTMLISMTAEEKNQHWNISITKQGI